ncbi:MAG TPA: DUF4412 domain-containing protein [Thermodesulfobacteriota bacterium]
MDRFSIKVCFLLLVVTLIPFVLNKNAFAGLVMEQLRYEQGGTQKDKGTIFISNNKIKFVQEKGTGVIIFNLNTGEMIQIDNESKRYVIAKPGEMKSALDTQISKLPPEQRAKVEEFMKSQSKPKKLTLKQTGISETIAEYKSQKYEIYQDGKLIREVWASKEAVPNNELDPGKMASYIKELERLKGTNGGGSNLDDQEKIFKQIYESGFPLRSVDHSSGNSVFIEEVVKITLADIPESEFQAPTGYKKMTLEEMLTQQ